MSKFKIGDKVKVVNLGKEGVVIQVNNNRYSVHGIQGWFNSDQLELVPECTNVLKKYIQYITETQGIDFLNTDYATSFFTGEELELLKGL